MTSLGGLLEQIRDCLLVGTADSSSVNAVLDGNPYNERILIGSRYLDANLGPPCIVLVPMGGDNFGTPEVPGQIAETPLLQSQHATFAAHCWGIDHDDARLLANGVFSALRYLLSAGNARVDNEMWPEHGHDVAGEILVRQFRAMGLSVEQVALPLTRPVTLATRRTVNAVGPTTLTAPVDDSNDSGPAGAFDVSIGVTPNG